MFKSRIPVSRVYSGRINGMHFTTKVQSEAKKEDRTEGTNLKGGGASDANNGMTSRLGDTHDTDWPGTCPRTANQIPASEDKERHHICPTKIKNIH